MQHFQDPATGKLWAFEDDVVVLKEPSGHTFKDARGNAIPAPAGLVPNTPLVPTAAESAWAAHQHEAAVSLQDARLQAVEFLMSGRPFPLAWVGYVAQLRAILAAASGTPGPMPVPPPGGTS